MKKIRTIALFSALAFALSSPLAHAEPKFFARAPIHEWHGQRFTIVQISQMSRRDWMRGLIENAISAYPEEVKALQAAIRQNAPLAAALRAQSVQLVNLVAIQQGFNGNLVFYLR